MGVDRKTSERIIGDPDGTYVVQDVKRDAFEDRWDAPFALSIVGIPWLPNPKGSDPKELAEAIVVGPECPDVIVEAPDVASQIKVPHRMYILKPDLDKHGCSRVSGLSRDEGWCSYAGHSAH